MEGEVVKGETTCTPDWSRERIRPGSWDPGRQLMRSIRLYQQASGPFAVLKRNLQFYAIGFGPLSLEPIYR